MSNSKLFYTLINDKNTIFQKVEFRNVHIIFRACIKYADYSHVSHIVIFRFPFPPDEVITLINRIEFTSVTACYFTSNCSPRYVTITQLFSVTKVWLPSTRTFTSLDVHPHERTGVPSGRKL